ncbi:hypothetical protein QQS21_002401 [Conoideocrella luteorostrata]|uniref:Uncharacterized protein n=1 Tax=Conoideocrella luteorostrata TaxID=1105319 RepID=A0AAJ0CVB6_9HYPO|nr:hypothetical protein QQS21_002401 [Conoideocrella luteorostrata]
MSFSFEFSGDDIEASPGDQASLSPCNQPQQQPEKEPGKASAFPVPGKPQLPPVHHDLKQMLSNMPSKIAYNTLDIVLDDGQTIKLPRRELWDVRVQLMAEAEEDEGTSGEGLGDHDVKTGVYEGGFKSWESSVDLVKVLAEKNHPNSWDNKSARIIEKTLPVLQDALSIEGELELTPVILDGFTAYLFSHNIHISFLSGGWSPDFIKLLYSLPGPDITTEQPVTLLLGAETIYSPFALQTFTEMVLSILAREANTFSADAAAWVAAKRIYFGVGGSLDDLVDKLQTRGALVTGLREEVEGVRRGVVHCVYT